MGKTYIQNPTRPLNLNFCILRRLRSIQRGTVGLCRSIGVKVGGLKKNSVPRDTSSHTSAARARFPDKMDHPQTLIACNFDASQSTETHSTSLERSQSP